LAVPSARSRDGSVEVSVRWRSLFGSLLVAGTLAVSTVPLSATAPASASTTLVRPDLATLEKYLAASVGINAPDLTRTIPPESVVTKTDYGRIPTVCFSPVASVGVPANAQGRCAFGDLTSARKILVFGDSVALQWIPALSQLGHDLHWRIVFLGKPWCSAWAYRSFAGTAGCRHYMREVVSFANRLHARYVMPMGAKELWRGSKNVSVRELRYEMAATVDALRPSLSRVLLMESIPQFNHGYTDWTPRICFQQYYNNMAVCENVIRHFAVTSTTSLAIWHFAIARRIHMIPTMPLFCSGIKCALFVTTPTGTYLVYRDATHMNRYYSNYIAGALETEMKPWLR
jgi:hypothetical protein